MPDRDYLLQQAEKCRRLAASALDAKLAGTLRGMAEEYESEAQRLASEEPQPRPQIP